MRERLQSEAAVYLTDSRNRERNVQRCNRCNVARLRWPISISKTGMATVETAVVVRGVAR